MRMESKQFCPENEAEEAGLLKPLTDAFTYRAAIVLHASFATMVLAVMEVALLTTMDARVGFAVSISTGFAVFISGYIAVKMEWVLALLFHSFFAFVSVLWGVSNFIMILLVVQEKIRPMDKLFGTRAFDMALAGIRSVVFFVNMLVGVSALKTLRHLHRARAPVARRDARLRAEAEIARQSLIVF